MSYDNTLFEDLEKEMKNIHKLINIELTSTTRPPIDKCFPIQHDKLFLKVLITDFHVSDFLGLTPTESLKIMNKTLSIL